MCTHCTVLGDEVIPRQGWLDMVQCNGKHEPICDLQEIDIASFL